MNIPKTLPRIMKQSAERWPEVKCQLTPNKDGSIIELNYHEVYQLALDFGAALLKNGVKRGDRIGIISENRREWEQADMGLLAIGAIDTPRGCDASEKDLSYILSFAEVQHAVLENPAQVKKILNIKKDIPTLTDIITFDPIDDDLRSQVKAAGLEYHLFSEMQYEGHEWRRSNPNVVEQELEKGEPDDLASIIFTSGTTGTPKGVMLTHRNFLTQLDEVNERIYLNPGQRALLVLPVWHAFQRAVEYVIMIQGAESVYSKPIGSILLNDIQRFNPYIIPAVPRVWEAVYDGIWRKMRKTGGITYALFRFFTNIALMWCEIDRKLRRKNSRFGHDFIVFLWIVLFIPWILFFPLKKLGDLLVFSKVRKMLGKNFRCGVAGGGAYPDYIDKFFWAAGVNVVEGYGLTETSPIISVRPIVDPICRNVGTPLRGIQVRIVDDDGIILGKCKKGNLQIKGDNVMKGYYKRPDLTEKVMTADGWFDTGDIAILTVNNEIQLRGRKKDTIVLMGGENIEPLPIETKINSSQYIAASMVFGQNEKGEDQRFLGALILPSKDDIESYAKENNIAYDTYEKLVETPEIHKLLETQIAELVNPKNGFKSFERINKFEIILKPFEVGIELSAKQEMMRYRIAQLYKDKIAKVYSEN